MHLEAIKNGYEVRYPYPHPLLDYLAWCLRNGSGSKGTIGSLSELGTSEAQDAPD